jgi:hypothetical protein
MAALDRLGIRVPGIGELIEQLRSQDSHRESLPKGQWISISKNPFFCADMAD